jgi:hypothetical protein
MFYKYKGLFSVVLMAVADTNYRFVYADIGRYGKYCDSATLNDLRYGHQFRQICWNYPVIDLFQERKVQMYRTPLYEMRYFRYTQI